MKTLQVLSNIQHEVAERITHKFQLNHGTIILGDIEKLTSLKSGYVISYLINFKIGYENFKVEIPKNKYIKAYDYVDIIAEKFIKQIKYFEALK